MTMPSNISEGCVKCSGPELFNITVVKSVGGLCVISDLQQGALDSRQIENICVAWSQVEQISTFQPMWVIEDLQWVLWPAVNSI